MMELVQATLAVHQRLAAARTQAEQDLYQRQIEATDREIDELVYELRPRGVPEAKRSGIRVDGG